MRVIIVIITARLLFIKIAFVLDYGAKLIARLLGPLSERVDIGRSPLRSKDTLKSPGGR